MNCRKVALSLAALAALATTPAQAQGETATSGAEALAIVPLSLVKEQDLDFGYIIPGTSNGFVTLSPANVVTTTGGIIVTGTTQNAAFYGFGRFNQQLRISLNANQFNLTRQGGTQTMRLDQVTIGSVPPVTIGTAPRTFRIASASGLFRFTVGGRLRVLRNQTPGTYTGQFTVSVEYL
mgnify:CR=1 FL=1